MKRNIWIGIGIVVVVALAIVIIVNQTKKEAEEIKIGVVLELTGPLSPYGERSKRAMNIVVEEINVSGGINGKKLVLIFEDDKSDPKEGVSAFRKLSEIHKVPIVTGAIGSSIVMACAPIANEKKVVLFSAGATSPLITDAGDYVFRNRLSGIDEVKAMADLALTKLKIDALAVLYVNTDYGKGNKDVFESIYSEHGGEILLSEGFEQGETDFRAILAKVKNSNPKGVYIIAHVIESAYILKQSKELHIRTQFLSTVGIEGPDLWKIAQDAANGVIYTVQKFDPESSRKAQLFNNKYSDRFEELPDLFAALGYDAISIIAKVIKDNGYNAEKIKSGLYQLKDFQGVIGKISFDKNGDIQSDIMMKIAKNGKFIRYKP